MNGIEIKSNLATLESTAAAIWAAGKSYAVWSFDGDMGAGKTTLISAICKYLNVQDAVSSPTYAIINQYEFREDGKLKTIYHEDWYRLKNETEAYEAGIAETLYQLDTYAFIEWASQAIALLDKPYFNIKITSISDNERLIYLQTNQ